MGLAHANANPTIAIAYDDQCSEGKTTTALHNLGYTIDIDNTFFKLRNVCLVFLFTSHLRFPLLELQACFTGAIGDRLNATMIEVATAIKDDLCDTFLLCLLADQLTKL